VVPFAIGTRSHVRGAAKTLAVANPNSATHGRISFLVDAGYLDKISCLLNFVEQRMALSMIG
jgi:hypothetical protein